MLRSTVYLCVLVLSVAAGCGKKKEGDSGKTVEQTTPAPPAVTCDKGQVADNGTCVVAVTQPKIDATRKQVDRLAEVEKLLNDVELVAGPIELLNAFRQLDAWTKAAATNQKLQEVDKVVITLDTAVKQLRQFKVQVTASKAKLADLQVTLEKVFQDSGAARTLAELRTQVSTDIKAAIQPLEAQVGATVQQAITPALAELTKVADLVDAGCAIGKVSGGGDQMRQMCKDGEAAIEKALAYLKGLEGKPVVFFTELVGELDTQLGDLVTAEAKQLLAEADDRVKKALAAPPAAPPAPAAPTAP